MVRQTRSIVALLMRLGTERRVQGFLAMELPVIPRRKSPSLLCGRPGEERPPLESAEPGAQISAPQYLQ